MLLTELPQEILLSVLTIENFDSFTLLCLAQACRNLATLALPELWKMRNFYEGKEYSDFKETIQCAKAYPYGEYVKSIHLNEVNKESSIYIDEDMIKFLSEKLPNLLELKLGFSSKPRKDLSCRLPLRLLADRLRKLSMVTYEHSDTPLTEDALCEIVECGNLKSIKLYYPRISNNLWDRFTQSAGAALEVIRITINNSLGVENNPSTITRSFARDCKNLRKFDLASFNLEPVSQEALLELIQAAPKLVHLDIPIASDAVTILSESTSIEKVYLSSTINGQDLKNFQRMDSLHDLTIQKIEGNCDFRFLNVLPNLKRLQISEYANMNDDAIQNITNLSFVEEIELLTNRMITDKGLSMFAFMRTLTKIALHDRLPNVTRDGWLRLVKRPPGCPSWVELSINDGRQIDAAFFEALHYEHPRLQNLEVCGINRNSYNDKAFSKLKFKEAWHECRNASKPLLNWPIRRHSKGKRTRNVWSRD